MTRNSDKRSCVTIDGESSKVLPTPPRVDLKTIDDVRLEMARVYREMRNNTIESQDGTRLIYVLAQIGKMIEIHDLEARLELLEGKENGEI